MKLQTKICCLALETTAAAAVAIALSTPSYALARSGGAFANMVGSWSGAGRIYTMQGAEPLRCRADYSVGEGAATMRQRLVCASPSYKFNVDSSVVDRGGNLSGTWNETSRGVSGQVAGVLRGDRVDAKIHGGSFAANLNLVTRGNTQSVTIVPQGTDVREVTVSLRRG
jgi:hypothetical protein